MPQFRLTIDTGPDGLPKVPSDFLLLANLDREQRALWPGEDPILPGRRYIYALDADDEADAEARVRDVVGSDLRIRVTPHGRRVKIELPAPDVVAEESDA